MKLRSRLNGIAFVILVMIFFDCVAFGGGSLVRIFGVDFRMVLYVLFLVSSTPLLIYDFKELARCKMLWCVIAWGAWLVVTTVNGVAKGNSWDLIISSWIGFASFAILPGALCVLRGEKRIVLLMKAAIVAATILAVQSMGILVLYQIMSGAAFDELNLFILYNELGGCTVVDNTIVRIFLRSHPLMIVSCCFSFHFLLLDKTKNRRLYYLNIVMCLWSIMISYTRSVYFGAIVAVIVMLVLFLIQESKDIRRKCIRTTLVLTGGFLGAILVCDVVFQTAFLSYGIYRTIGIDVLGSYTNVVAEEQLEEKLFMQEISSEVLETEEISAWEGKNAATEHSQKADYSTQYNKKTQEVKGATDTTDVIRETLNVNAHSDSVRQATQMELYQKIAKKPIIGYGVGAKLDVRPEGDNEYFFLDITFKMGIVGCVLFVLPVIGMTVFIIKRLLGKKIQGMTEVLSWYAGLIGIIAFSWFNPYLNGTNGIVLYCLTICVFNNYMNQWPIYKGGISKINMLPR